MKEEKEFMFPLNYKEKEKILGFVDYKTGVVIGGMAFIMFFILKNMNITLIMKLSVFIVVIGFFSILILVGVNGENMLDFFKFMVKYYLRERVYVYRKSENEKEGICERLLKRGSK